MLLVLFVYLQCLIPGLFAVYQLENVVLRWIGALCLCAMSLLIHLRCVSDAAREVYASGTLAHKTEKRTIRKVRGSLFGGGWVYGLVGTVGYWLWYALLYGGQFRNGLMWLGGVVGILGASVAQVFWERHKLRLQKTRDRATDSPGPFALYLRPFFSDSTFLLPNPFAWNVSVSMGFELLLPGHLGLGPEEFVGRVLEPFIRVRQVGGSSSTVGNARAYVGDDAWGDVVKEWVAQASVIIILPVVLEDATTEQVHGRATIWELEYLVRSGRLSHTVVIMPPVQSSKKSNSTAEGWGRAQAIAATFDLILPDYDARGGFMTFHQSGDLWLRCEWFPGRFRQQAMGIGLIKAVHSLAKRHGF